MIEKISDNVWKCKADSNVYFLKLDENIIIDTGRRKNRNTLQMFLSKLVDFSSVKKVIFTHLHHDHIGNFDLFSNAEFFASRKEIDDFKKDPEGTVVNEDMVKKFNVDLKSLEKEICGLEVIETPGHTRGSICLWYAEKGILFSGDTLFKKKQVGRTDLATSAPEELNNSIVKLVGYNFKILCPGHEY